MKPVLIAVVVALTLVVPAAQVMAWGSTGHRLIGLAAMRALPDALPAFLRSPDAAMEVGELSREPDRWKGGGQPHGRERDTAHFINLDQNGRVLNEAGLSIDALPLLKSEYDAALQLAGSNVNEVGYLPYAIMDGWQQVVRNLAYWRVLHAQSVRETDPGRKAWYLADLRRREALAIRDIGILSHYVGDASQPHHTTIHYNGWGDYPNPEGFTNSRQTHSMFEGAFTRRTATLQRVEQAMAAPQLGDFEMRARTATYLRATLAEVTPFYRLEKAGGFTEANGTPDPRGAAFVTSRLAAGAAELRDLITLAWIASAEASVGWPAIRVSDVEAGRVDPWPSMIGED
jgi:hypothetical protein